MDTKEIWKEGKNKRKRIFNQQQPSKNHGNAQPLNTRPQTTCSKEIMSKIST
jgi:hypothetical protein